MAIEVADQQKRHLIGAIKAGRCILILGAGASKTSRNRKNTDVKVGWELASYLATEAGYTYDNEPLADVLDAVRPHVISDPRFEEILREEYLHIRPSAELSKLFKYSWVRCYTWNIDDSVENVRDGVQSRLEFNGLVDSVYTDHSGNQLPLIHLHGQAQKPDNGFIFSKTEYNNQIHSGRHKWYKQLSIDYGSFVPTFIGSKLDEPMLSLELDRARPKGSRTLGQAYLIDPGTPTEIQLASHAARNVVYCKGSLDEFVALLEAEIGNGNGPGDVAASRSNFAAGINTKYRLNSAEVEASQNVVAVSALSVDAELRSYDPSIFEKAARIFLEGGPPNWRIARSNASVVLAQTHELGKFVSEVMANSSQLMGVVTGQLGSGKTTALMQALLTVSEIDPKIIIYEIKEQTKSLRSACELLNHVVSPDYRSIIYIPNIAAFGDSFIDDIELLDPRRFTVFTSVRSGEWRGRIGRRLLGNAVEFNFQRFGEADYGPLISKLLSYVPSPALLKLNERERVQKLALSNSQLLIAMKEATSAKAFNDLITDEYEGLATPEAKILLLMAGLGSLARSGVSRGALEIAFFDTKPACQFDETLDRLEGVVVEKDGRYFARHELYVRHIFENVADLDDILGAIASLLSTFTQVMHPIIKNVPRLDEILFKFLLNHNFVKDLAVRHGEKEAGLKIYERFDRAFQLDGHFWLQYGQYLSEIRRFPEALDKLEKSIEAFPNNQFAIHALADLQLKVAKLRSSYDAETKQLVRDAVETLNSQDASPEIGGDYYPIVTLANEHISALVVHKQRDEAKRAAEDYAERIKFYRKSDDSASLRAAHRRLLTYLATGELIGAEY